MPLNKCSLTNGVTARAVESGEVQTEGKQPDPESPPTPPVPPSFHSPGLAEVIEWFGQNRKSPELAEEWFTKFGADPEWLTFVFRKACRPAQ
jgi:hypothetical protein